MTFSQTMKYKIYMVAIAIAVVTLVALVTTGHASTGRCLALGTVILLLLILAWRAIAKPLNAVENGIYLLREQDFSSRLRLTGQSDADRVVDLFNNLMDTMRGERLKLTEQNRFLSLLVEASPMGVAVCDYDGNIVSTNKAWDSFESSRLMEIISTLKRDESLTTRLSSSMIIKCSHRWFMDSGFRRSFYLVERLTDEIVHAEKMIYNKVVRTIGHEVNNTLGSVISVLDTLSDINRDDTMVVDTLQSCNTSCRNLVDFVKGYASIVKLPQPRLLTGNIGDAVSSMMTVLQGLATANITIALENNSPSTCSFDKMLLERVMVNIVTNSIESIGNRPDGMINISIHRNTLNITDNGHGINPENAQRLFTPFFSTKHPDRGLGLMLIADILRQHNATFDLITDPKTHLTTFSISFPNRLP